MRINLECWRQNGPSGSGHLETRALDNVDGHVPSPETLDVFNEELFDGGKKPLAFDSDCHEGICGQCGIVINGDPHGPRQTMVCQLHIRAFKDGDTITLEPWRSKGFPIIKDLVVDHSAFDRIVQAGSYISVNIGAAPEAYSQLVSKGSADHSLEATTCTGCGTCAATCPNGSAMLFTPTRVIRLSFLPQRQPECRDRVVNMLAQQGNEGLDSCTNVGACVNVCSKGIPLELISLLNCDLIKSYGHKARQR